MFANIWKTIKLLTLVVALLMACVTPLSAQSESPTTELRHGWSFGSRAGLYESYMLCTPDAEGELADLGTAAWRVNAQNTKDPNGSIVWVEIGYPKNWDCTEDCDEQARWAHHMSSSQRLTNRFERYEKEGCPDLTPRGVPPVTMTDPQRLEENAETGDCPHCEFYLTTTYEVSEGSEGKFTVDHRSNDREALRAKAVCCDEVDVDLVALLLGKAGPAIPEGYGLQENRIEPDDRDTSTSVLDRIGGDVMYLPGSDAIMGSLVYRLPLGRKFEVFGGPAAGIQFRPEHDVEVNDLSATVTTQQHSWVGITAGGSFALGKRFHVGAQGFAWGVDRDDFAIGPFAGVKLGKIDLNIGAFAGEQIKGLGLRLGF